MTPKDSARDGTTPWVGVQNLLSLAVVVCGPLQGHGWHDGFGAAGVILFLIGAFLGVKGVRDLGAQRVASPVPGAEARLIETGVYGWVRHPLYASLIASGLGWSLIWRSEAALVVTMMLTGWLLAKARLEERLMTARFPEYAGYARRVRRFIPGVW